MTLGMGKVLTASCLILLYAPSAAADLFTVTDLGTLGGYSSSVAVGINNKGQIVGTVIGADGCSGNGLACQAFLYSGGGMIGLGTLGGNSGSTSLATGINNKGQVVGESTTKVGTQGFLYSNGVMIGLGTLGGNSGSASVANSINNKGQVVGYSKTIPGGPADAFVLNNVVMTGLGTLAGYDTSYATGINDKSQVVGYVFAPGAPHPLFEAFLYSDGVMMGLGTLGGNSGSASVATGINDKGQVVGYSNAIPGGPADAFLYNDGVMTGLGTLAGYDTSYATGINNKGQVVGYVAQTTASSETVSEAFLYDHGVMTDISPPGWSNTTATAINAKGQIVGYGINPEGAEHAFLLTPDPAPDPASVFLLGTVVIGLGAFAFARKRLRQDLRGGVLPPRTGLTTARAAPASLLHIYTSIHPI